MGAILADDAEMVALIHEVEARRQRGEGLPDEMVRVCVDGDVPNYIEVILSCGVTMSDVKGAIEAFGGIPLSKQILSMSGTRLADSASLDSYKGQTIYLAVRRSTARAKGGNKRTKNVS